MKPWKGGCVFCKLGMLYVVQCNGSNISICLSVGIFLAQFRHYLAYRVNLILLCITLVGLHQGDDIQYSLD